MAGQESIVLGPKFVHDVGCSAARPVQEKVAVGGSFTSRLMTRMFKVDEALAAAGLNLRPRDYEFMPSPRQESLETTISTMFI